MFLERKSDIFTDGHRLKKGTELKVHSKTKPDAVELLGGGFCNILTKEVDRARGGLLSADEDS